MPYTIVWSDTTPAGSELADTASAYFRNTKKAIDERLTDILVNDWTADPLVVKDKILGNVAAKYLSIHPSEISWVGPLSVGWHDQPSADYLTVINPNPGTGNQFGYLPIASLPPGVTITDFAVLGSGDGVGTTSVSLYKVSIASAASPHVPVLLKSVNLLGTFGAVDAIGPTELVDPLFVYYFVINASVTFTHQVVLQGIQLQYSTPDCRSTR